MNLIRHKDVSDVFWARVEPLIPVPERSADRRFLRKPGGGRKPIPPRKVLFAILHVLRSGCPWKNLPHEFGSSSAVHKYFVEWERAGFFDALWRAGLAEYEEMEGVAWSWQKLDRGRLHATPEAETENTPSTNKKPRRHARELIAECCWRPAIARRQRD